MGRYKTKIFVNFNSFSFPFQNHFKNGITVGVATNKVMACLIPYLKIPLNIGDFIFAVSANLSIFIVLNVHRVAVLCLGFK